MSSGITVQMVGLSRRMKTGSVGIWAATSENERRQMSGNRRSR